MHRPSVKMTKKRKALAMIPYTMPEHKTVRIAVFYLPRTDQTLISVQCDSFWCFFVSCFANVQLRSICILTIRFYFISTQTQVQAHIWEKNWLHNSALLWAFTKQRTTENYAFRVTVYINRNRRIESP